MLFKKSEAPAEMLPAVQVVSGGVYFGIIKTASPIRIEGDFKGIIFCTNKVLDRFGGREAFIQQHEGRYRDGGLYIDVARETEKAEKICI